MTIFFSELGSASYINMNEGEVLATVSSLVAKHPLNQEQVNLIINICTSLLLIFFCHYKIQVKMVKKSSLLNLLKVSEKLSYLILP